jgi:hypothetical protein
MIVITITDLNLKMVKELIAEAHTFFSIFTVPKRLTSNQSGKAVQVTVDELLNPKNALGIDV